MADGNIKLYGKLKSVTEEGKVADYLEIDGVPIIMQDLSASGFTPTANTYYLHIGETTITYNNGMIYFYNGSTYIQVGGGDLALENGTGDVLVQTTDSNQSFKVMADGRAKVYGEPTESNDVLRLNEFSVLTQSQVDLLF